MTGNTPTTAKLHFWNIAANPIFRRYCRSRLRPRGLGVSLLGTVLLAGFIFAIARSAAIYQSDMSLADAERAPLIPLIVLQGFILFFLGIAQAAGGMTAERDEGVLDYQRLLPMSPLAKVAGYLFGLPVREYVMFLVTLPFSAWALWRGGVPASAWAPVYVVMISSAVLYHLTGMVTGMVARNRRWAFLFSIGLVFALYTVIPQLANFGLVFFKYLTVSPVYTESLPAMLPRDAGALVEVGRRLAPTAKFFGLDFPELVFTLFSQGGLILTFVAILRRRWRRTESHLLGKAWAVALFVWIQVLLLGNALPLVESGEIFPSRGLADFVVVRPDYAPEPAEALGLIGVYGLFTLALLFVLASIITPAPESQLRGWRRAKKQGEAALPTFSDSASASGFTLAMILAGAAGWYLFARGLVESRWFPGQSVDPPVLACFAAVLFAGAFGLQCLLEARGTRPLVLTVIFAVVLPVMVAAVVTTAGERLVPVAVWLAGISPASLPAFGPLSVLALAELPEPVARAIPRAFYFWLAVWSLVGVWLGVRLHGRRRELARGILGGEPVSRA